MPEPTEFTQYTVKQTQCQKRGSLVKPAVVWLHSGFKRGQTGLMNKRAKTIILPLDVCLKRKTGGHNGTPAA